MDGEEEIVPADLETRTFTSADAAVPSYRVRPGGNPLVLLHALGCDASPWDGVVAAALAAR